MCGEVQWSSLGRNRPAVVGFNSEGNFFKNHPLSGLSGIGDAVSCTFDVGKRRKRQDGEPPNNMMDELDADQDVQAAVDQCMDARNTDELAYFGTTLTPQILAEMLDPCPCSLQQAMEDRARFVEFNERGNCYVSSFPVDVLLPAFGSITLTQMCCYENG